MVTSDKKINNVEIEGFPRLKHGGGFELMQCLPNSRMLRVVNTTFNVKDIRSHMTGSQCKIYIRLIQTALDTTPIEVKQETQIKEKCQHCGLEFLFCELRKHILTCHRRRESLEVEDHLCTKIEDEDEDEDEDEG